MGQGRPRELGSQEIKPSCQQLHSADVLVQVDLARSSGSTPARRAEVNAYIQHSEPTAQRGTKCDPSKTEGMLSETNGRHLCTAPDQGGRHPAGGWDFPASRWVCACFETAHLESGRVTGAPCISALMQRKGGPGKGVGLFVAEAQSRRFGHS